MRTLTTLTTLFALTIGAGAAAQEGLETGKMWTFENPPLAYLEKEYGVR